MPTAFDADWAPRAGWGAQGPIPAPARPRAPGRNLRPSPRGPPPAGLARFAAPGPARVAFSVASLPLPCPSPGPDPDTWRSGIRVAGPRQAGRVQVTARRAQGGQGPRGAGGGGRGDVAPEMRAGRIKNAGGRSVRLGSSGGAVFASRRRGRGWRDTGRGGWGGAVFERLGSNPGAVPGRDEFRVFGGRSPTVSGQGL